MGKKKDKKGKGAEKTFQKTDKKAEKKLKKELQKKGEDDIEKLIAEFQEQDKKRAEIVEEKCAAPGPRCNMSFTAHPDRDDLIMFGGEYFNGKQTLLYNELYFYNIRNNDWTLVKAPTPPPPRCAHQAVAVSQAGGQLWVFGGEFASPTQSQFYHYKDLWVLSLRDKTWQKINAPGAPSARSGHRMVACKKLLLVFGGFHDNIRDYKYYNDLFAFNLETYSWFKLEVTGVPPLLRSACIMTVSQDQNHVVIYGGYSKEKIKKDVDQGKTHTDMVTLSVDSRCKHDSVPTKWKWLATKQSGCRPSQRCGCSVVVVPGNRAIVFGGVFDEVEDEEEVEGVFFNDMYSLELDKAKWHQVILRGKKDLTTKKKRRKKRESPDGSGDQADEEEEGDEDEDEEMEQELDELTVDDTEENMDVENKTNPSVDLGSMDVENKTNPSVNPGGMDVEKSTVSPVEPAQEPGDSAVSPPGDCSQDDDIFTVTIKSSSNVPNNASSQSEQAGQQEVFVPGKRMNTLLAVKHGILYMYGGMYEVGDKQYTLSDMYSLDLHKLDVWNTIIACDLNLQDWQDSEESSGEDGEGEDVGEEDMESDSEDDDDEDEEMEESTPDIKEGESLDEYYQRTTEYWFDEAATVAQDEGMKVSEKQLKKAASRMAKEHYKEQHPV